MSTRYATFIPGNDGEEIVSTVGQFEGGAPHPRSVSARSRRSPMAF